MPKFAADFERQWEAVLLKGAVTKDEMRTITEATRQLIEGGTIRLRPCKEGVKGRVVLHGFGSRVLRLGGTARGTRVSGSGGALPEFPTGDRAALNATLGRVFGP